MRWEDFLEMLKALESYSCSYLRPGGGVTPLRVEIRRDTNGGWYYWLIERLDKGVWVAVEADWQMPSGKYVLQADNVLGAAVITVEVPERTTERDS